MRNIFLSLSIILIFTACKPDKEVPVKTTYGNFEIELEHFWGHSHGTEEAPEFALNQTVICEESGDTLSFNKLKYYVSNIVFTSVTGQKFAEKESYHLIEFVNNQIPSIIIDSIPTGEYTSLSFIIGVDSTRNVSGIQEGDLSPTKEMFWSWTMGYRFIIVEGNVISASGNMDFVYHLGGFSGANNALNELQFPFGENLTTNPYATPTLHLKIDVSALWTSTFTLSSNMLIEIPNTKAVTAAANFAEGFELDHTHQ